MGKDDPEGFSKDIAEAKIYRRENYTPPKIFPARPYQNTNNEEIDGKRVIKAISLGVGISFISISLLIKFIGFWERISFSWPRLSFENNLLLIGAFVLIPYIGITIYEKMKRKPKSKRSGKRKNTKTKVNDDVREN